MDYIINYWAQITLFLGVLSYFVKLIFDYSIRKKELKTKYFYELKAQKIIDLHKRIVEIQMTIDRKKKGNEKTFGTNIFKQRISLDQYFWESQLYFNEKTQEAFKNFLYDLKIFELPELYENTNFEREFKHITNQLLKEFKRELK